MFADAQHKLAGDSPRLRLLSISIDPLGDDRKALGDWMARFDADPRRWTAALPKVADVDRRLDFVWGRANGADRHTPQAYVFDRSARLAYRTEDLPSGQQLVDVMRQVAKLT